MNYLYCSLPFINEVSYETVKNIFYDISITIVSDLVKNGIKYVTQKIYKAVKTLIDIKNNKIPEIAMSYIDPDYLLIAYQIISDLGNYENIIRITYNNIERSNFKSRFSFDFISANVHDSTLIKTDYVKDIGYRIAEQINFQTIYIIPVDSTTKQMLRYFKKNNKYKN